MKETNRIWILGAIGSGKTHFAERLSKKLKIRHYQLDDIYWQKKWTEMRSERLRIKMLTKIAKNKHWIIEGVFSDWIEQGIKKADLVIWIEPSISVIIWRLFVRYIKGKLKGHPEELKAIIQMIRLSKAYKKSNGLTYLKHKVLVRKHKLKVIVVKNNKQLINLLEELDV